MRPVIDHSFLKNREISKKQLIRIIKEKSVIWDRTDPRYRDKVQREIAWKEVYDAVKPGFGSLPTSVQIDLGNHITKRWYNLRDSYVKARKKSRIPNVHAEMSFLDAIYYYLDECNSETEWNNTDDSKMANGPRSVADSYNRSSRTVEEISNDTKKDDSDNTKHNNKQRRSSNAMAVLKAKPISVELIKLVEEKKLLWDKTSVNYRDKVKRDRAWREIFKAIVPTYEDLNKSEQNEVGDYITRKWNNVRDAYLKNIKNNRPYVHGDVLKFLDPHILDSSYYEIEYCKVNEHRNTERNSFDNNVDASFGYDHDTLKRPRRKSKLQYNSADASASEPNVRRMSTMQLIKVIKKEKSLWDKTCSRYADKAKQEESWRAVFKALVPSFDELSKERRRKIGNEITRKWRKVENHYHRSLMNGAKKRPHLYSRMLSFLDCQYYNENTLETEFINTDALTPDDVNPEQRAQDDVPMLKKEFLELSGDIFEDAERPDLASAPGVDDNDQINISSEEEKRLMAILSNLIAREEDEDMSFFNAILSSVKSLSDDSKLAFRMNVLKLIQTLKKRDLDGIFIKQEPT